MTMAVLAFASCRKDDDDSNTNNNGGGTTSGGPRLVFKFDFDSTMQRLNNLGQPATIPAGNAAQSPRFRSMSAHYLELAPNTLTALGAGEVLYHAPETTAGGENAIDFSQSVRVAEGETFLSIPLSQVAAGTYPWLRVSLAYQNYDIQVRSQTFDLTGTIASFVGFNTYITSHVVNTQSIDVNGNKKQGYWAFETSVLGTPYVTSGQAPEGATTVPNPLFATSPIPAGSCVVTGQFTTPLTITGNETEDVVVTVKLSTNKSFEWVDGNANGLYEPALGENVVDMGLRGMEAGWE
jgi:hypothetical protein